MSVAKLISECFPTKDGTNLATCTGEGGVLVGHAFGTTLQYSSGKVLWITQLVVHPQYRKRGIATFLLRSLRHPDHIALGIASSHPAACLAALRSTKTNILDLDLSFAQSTIRSVLDTSPVPYIATAKPCGSLFGSEEHGTCPPAESSREVVNGRSEPICTMFTSFYVDHAEIKEGLEEWMATYRRAGKEQEWPLGGLREGHEYLVLVKCS